MTYTFKTARKLRITYDDEADALTIELVPGKNSARTVEQGPGVYADFSADDKLISIEVLDASSRYPKELLETLNAPIQPLTLAQAAEESGIAAATLRKQIHNRRIKAIKQGRDWIIPRHELVNYLSSRAPQGRPSTSAKAWGRKHREQQLS
jgi:excisionase family DNA binding protein